MVKINRWIPHTIEPTHRDFFSNFLKSSVQGPQGILKILQHRDSPPKNQSPQHMAHTQGRIDSRIKKRWYSRFVSSNYCWYSDLQQFRFRNKMTHLCRNGQLAKILSFFFTVVSLQSWWRHSGQKLAAYRFLSVSEHHASLEFQVSIHFFLQVKML